MITGRPRAARGEGLLEREQRGLRVQRVEDGLDQDQVDPPSSNPPSASL
jgi:hypothetical protein